MKEILYLHEPQNIFICVFIYLTSCAKIYIFSGVIPNTDFLSGSKLEIDSRKTLVVDKVT